MKIYIAGGSSERFAVREMGVQLTEAGATVTHDWTDDPGFGRGCGREFLGAGGTFFCGSTAHEGTSVLCSTCTDPKRIAALDRAAVDAADVVWLMTPREKSEGAAWELGYAVARGKLTIVSMPRPSFPFAAEATARVDTHEEAFRLIVDVVLPHLAALDNDPHTTSRYARDAAVREYADRFEFTRQLDRARVAYGEAVVSPGLEQSRRLGEVFAPTGCGEPFGDDYVCGPRAGLCRECAAKLAGKSVHDLAFDPIKHEQTK